LVDEGEHQNSISARQWTTNPPATDPGVGYTHTPVLRV
jgi:hypothetical protein